MLPARAPRVNDLIAEGAEHRLGALENFCFSADHHFVNAARRARLARGHRRVEHMRAFSAKIGSSWRINAPDWWIYRRKSLPLDLGGYSGAVATCSTSAGMGRPS